MTRGVGAYLDIEIVAVTWISVSGVQGADDRHRTGYVSADSEQEVNPKVFPYTEASGDGWGNGEGCVNGEKGRTYQGVEKGCP